MSNLYKNSYSPPIQPTVGPSSPPLAKPTVGDREASDSSSRRLRGSINTGPNTLAEQSNRQSNESSYGRPTSSHTSTYVKFDSSRVDVSQNMASTATLDRDLAAQSNRSAQFAPHSLGSRAPERSGSSRLPQTIRDERELRVPSTPSYDQKDDSRPPYARYPIVGGNSAATIANGASDMPPGGIVERNTFLSTRQTASTSTSFGHNTAVPNVTHQPYPKPADGRAGAEMSSFTATRPHDPVHGTSRPHRASTSDPKSETVESTIVVARSGTTVQSAAIAEHLRLGAADVSIRTQVDARQRQEAPVNNDSRNKEPNRSQKEESTISTRPEGTLKPVTTGVIRPEATLDDEVQVDASQRREFPPDNDSQNKEQQKDQGSSQGFVARIFGRAGKVTKAAARVKRGSIFRVKTEDLNPDDLIIAVMGPTGTGKSSFINMATGNNTGVGHQLESCTNEINILKFQCFERSSQDVIFVDTPGFDDTHKSDIEILNMIADWLKKTYERQVKLAGILYFHRISDNRMAGTPLKNLHMFEKLCGKNALGNIILTTTMWDEVDEDTGVQREKELIKNYWKSMINQGSQAFRYQNNEESAWSIVDTIVQSHNEKYAMELQHELVDLEKELPETGAGRELYGKLRDLVARQQDTLQRLRASMKRQDDEAILTALKDEYEGLRKQLEQTVLDMEELKIPIGKRLRRFFSLRLGFFNLRRKGTA